MLQRVKRQLHNITSQRRGVRGDHAPHDGWHPLSVHVIALMMTFLLTMLVPFLFFHGVVCAQTDSEIRELIGRAGDSKDYPGASKVTVFDMTDVDVEDSGLAHVRRHTLTKILTLRGVLDEAVQRFNYDPASNFIRVESIRIFRTDGSIEQVDTSTMRDLFAPAYMIYWGARMKIIGLPRLEIGDAVEIKTYKKGFEIAYLAGEFDGRWSVPGAAGIPRVPGISLAGKSDKHDATEEDDSRYAPPMQGHFYDVVIFQGGHPIKEKRYDLHVPINKPVQYEVYNGTLFSSQRFDEERVHCSWWLLDIPALKRESRMAAVSDVATKLVLATVPSWQEKSRWFASIHDTIFLDNADIREEVREITKGLDDDIEKVAALQHWAAQEIRYSGISMGKGEGYTIHPGKMIFYDRCGVCKDKAGMLVTLMRSAGYEVYPALTMAGSRVERIPADQFNHCVVAWRREDGSYTMLDPTWVPYSTELWSSAEQEQNYVIGTTWGEDLMQTPYSHPENHVMRIVSRANIDGEGNLQGTMKISGTNYTDQRMRRYLGTHRKDDLKAFIEGWLSQVSKAVELEEYSIGDPLDFASEFSLEFTYRIPRYALVDDGKLDFLSPAWGLAVGNRYLFAASTYVKPEQREYPLFVWFTQTLECDETVRLPRGKRPFGDFSKDIDESGEYASFAARRSIKGRIIENRGKVLIKRRMIPPDRYTGFREILNGVRDYSMLRIVVE